MRHEDTCEDIRNALNGRPGQPIVFGVCRTIAGKFGFENWVVRAVTIVLGLFFTLPVLAAYIVAGLVMKETEARTRGFFSGLTVMIREWSDKLFSDKDDSDRYDRYDRGYR